MGDRTNDMRILYFVKDYHRVATGCVTLVTNDLVFVCVCVSERRERGREGGREGGRETIREREIYNRLYNALATRCTKARTLFKPRTLFK